MQTTPRPLHEIRCPFAFNKMSFDQNSGTVVYRSKLRATLKRKTAYANIKMAAPAFSSRPGQDSFHGVKVQSFALFP